MSVKTNPRASSGKSKKDTKQPAEITQETDDHPHDIWEKFGLELKWCVDQLEAQLSSKKLNQRQTMEASKVLKGLTNPKAHLIKKKQLMRTTFGDYRLKMKQEELKFNKQMKKITVSAVTPSHQKGTFLKQTETSKSSNASESLGNESVENMPVVSDEVSKPVFSFKKSDNSFKFNFSVENIVAPT